METSQQKSATTNTSTSTPKSIADDVLHLGSPTKLSAEEIAKAVAHHNRHHQSEKPQKAPPGKKNR